VTEFLAVTGQQEDMGATYATYEGMRIEFAGHAIRLGPMAAYGPKMRLANRSEIEAAAKDTANPIARFVCIDDEGLYVLCLKE
jgi:hypothetical protein